MTVKNSSSNSPPFQPEDDSLNRWYNRLKERGYADAKTWLVNMRMIDRLYGKTPSNIAQMKPEEAYNFLIEIVKSMKNEGRTFTHIDSMVSCVNDWLEFNDPSMKQDLQQIDPSLAASNPIEGSLPYRRILTKQSAESPERGFITEEQLILLRERSDELLSAHGSGFIKKMRALEDILMAFDPAPDVVTSSIDVKVNEGVKMDLGAYYFAAYSSTRDVHKALKVHRLTNSLMRYIALMDGFYETGDKEGLVRANLTLDEVTLGSNAFLRYLIKYSMERVWPFWMYENMIKQRITEGDLFSDKELRYFILFKSSDTPMIYCSILDNYISTFNPNVALFFHYNQALIDIVDDYIDLNEDLRTTMPNVFLMASSRDFLTSQGLPPKSSEELMSKDVREKMISLVDWLSMRINEISLPSEYAFLRYLTTEHIDRLDAILQ